MNRLVASVGAVVAGFAITAIASVMTDALMHMTGVFPSDPKAMSSGLFALATSYRAAFTVAGGFTTAKLAPRRPMFHAWVLAVIGLIAGLAGVIAYFTIEGANIGPAWYALSIPLEAIPCVLLGGWLARAGERAIGSIA